MTTLKQFVYIMKRNAYYNTVSIVSYVDEGKYSQNPTTDEISSYKTFYRANRNKLRSSNYSQKYFDTPRIISTVN